MTVVFYDLDKTLLSINSAKIWAMALWRSGRISNWRALAAYTWLIKYNLGFSFGSLEQLQKVCHAFKGISENDFETFIIERFYKNMITKVQPMAFEKIAEHKNLGHKNVIITSSPRAIAKVVSEYLQMDDILATELELELDPNQNKIFTGNILGQFCFGRQKVNIAKKYLEKKFKESGLENCYFYTDSHTDLPLLKAVKFPIAVNPDFRLKRFAKKHHWRIEDWRKKV